MQYNIVMTNFSLVKGTTVNVTTVTNAIVNFATSADALIVQLGHSGLYRTKLPTKTSAKDFYLSMISEANAKMKKARLGERMTLKTIQNKERIGLVILTMGDKVKRAEFDKAVKVDGLCPSLSSYASFLNPKAKEVKKGHKKASNGSNMTLTAKVGKSMSTLVISKDLIVASAQLADLQSQLAELVKAAQPVKA